MIYLANGIIYADGQPLLRFASNPQAGIYMLGLNFRAFERNGTFYFFRPKS